MKLTQYLLTALSSTSNPVPKICRDCKHFMGDKKQCAIFGDTDLVSGEVSYPSARQMRDDEKKCGTDAVRFEKNHFKLLTVPYYFAKEYRDVFMPFLYLLVLYSYVIWYSLSRS